MYKTGEQCKNLISLDKSDLLIYIRSTLHSFFLSFFDYLLSTDNNNNNNNNNTKAIDPTYTDTLSHKKLSREKIFALLLFFCFLHHDSHWIIVPFPLLYIY